MGKRCPIVLDVKWSNTKIIKKIHGGLNRPPIGKSTHDNQPKEGVHNRGESGEGARPGYMWVTCNTIVLAVTRCK
jgi:hypothetical protein